MLRDERMSAIMREPKTFNSWWVLNKVCGSTNLSSFRLFQERALIELPRIDAFPNATDQDKNPINQYAPYIWPASWRVKTVFLLLEISRKWDCGEIFTKKTSSHLCAVLCAVNGRNI